jgi:hypothetical protein
MREEVAWVLSFFITIAIMVIGGGIYLAIRKALSKRPHESDDEEDNPIIKFKDDLAEIYEDNPNGKLKKLAQAVWNRVEEIEKWHKEEIHDWERKYYSAKWDVGELSVKCDGYREELDEWTKRCEELQSKLNESQERLKRESAKTKTLESETDKLRDMLKEEQEKNKIPIFSDQTEVPAYLINDNAFDSQINSFAKIILNTKPGEPIPVGYSGTAKTATEATELAERLQRIASQPIVMDSESLTEPQIKNEEFIKQLRDWWGLEASKAVELPNADKERLSADELRRKYAWFLALYKNPNNEPLKRFKVRVIGTYNNDRDSLLTDWILPATSINEIRNVLGEDGIRVLGGEELPI